MERKDDSNKKPFKDACYSILTIVVGLLSSSIITVLAYFTYQAAAGHVDYCTIWTDVPGRIAIFITFYYAAGVCGTLPLPNNYRMNCLPQPFIPYKLKSWKNLFRKVCLLFSSMCNVFTNRRRNPERSPLQTNCFPSEPSDNIPIVNAGPSNYRSFRSSKIARDREEKIATCSERSMSFDSSIGGQIVPMVKGRSSKVRYFTDSTLSTTGSSDKSIYLSAKCEILGDLSGSVSDQAKPVGEIREDTTPPRTPEVEFPIPKYPRFPWSFLKETGGVPQEARTLHKRHLLTERRELGKYIKKQKLTTEFPKESKSSESDWMTNSNDVILNTNRPPSLLSIPVRSKVSFRGRTKTLPANLRKLQKLKAQARRRTVSCNVPRGIASTTEIVPTSESNFDGIYEANKCCENSPDLQSKVDYIRKTLKKLEPGSQVDDEAHKQDN